MEAFSYYLIKASMKLAKETGACELVDETRYIDGQVPIDTYKKEVDELVDPIYKMDWETLRDDLRRYGIRNSTLMCQFPSETSS
jgi:ribonucleoside-diphosphate reductase alpha chain